MRQITQKIIHAFEGRYELRIDNSRTDGTSLWLFGNKIAEWCDNGLSISNGGWNSRTTKERLNGLTGVRIQQVRGTWYVNGRAWDGRWINVDDFTRGVDSMPEESVQEAEFDVTSEWMPEGYSKPVYAVFHSLKEASIEPVEAMLNGEGIPTRKTESDTDGVYRPNYFVVVRPEDVDKSVRILSEAYCLA
jgi:hypothetical protein